MFLFAVVTTLEGNPLNVQLFKSEAEAEKFKMAQERALKLYRNLFPRVTDEQLNSIRVTVIPAMPNGFSL